MWASLSGTETGIAAGIAALAQHRDTKTQRHKGFGKQFGGAAALTVRKSWTFLIAPVSDGGEIVQPTRHPVTLYVFDNPLIVTVRSAIPSIVAIGTCWR